MAWWNGDPTSRPRQLGIAGVRSGQPPRGRPSRRRNRRPSASPTSTPSSSGRTPGCAAGPATDSGATRSTARGEPRLSSWSSQTTSVRSGMAGVNDVRIRDAVSEISLSAATASARAEAALASLVVSIADRGRTGRIAQRGQVGRQLVVEVIDAARRRVVDRRRRSWPTPPPVAGSVPGPTSRVIRREATPSAADVSSAVATDVTRSTNSCASSTTSSACSGSTADSDNGIDGQQRVVGDDDVGAARRAARPVRKSTRCQTGSAPRRCIPARKR